MKWTSYLIYGYREILSGLTSLVQRNKLSFDSAVFGVTDNAGLEATVVTLASGVSAIPTPAAPVNQVIQNYAAAVPSWGADLKHGSSPAVSGAIRLSNGDVISSAGSMTLAAVTVATVSADDVQIQSTDDIILNAGDDLTISVTDDVNLTVSGSVLTGALDVNTTGGATWDTTTGLTLTAGTTATLAGANFALAAAGTTIMVDSDGDDRVFYRYGHVYSVRRVVASPDVGLRTDRTVVFTVDYGSYTLPSPADGQHVEVINATTTTIFVAGTKINGEVYAVELQAYERLICDWDDTAGTWWAHYCSPPIAYIPS